MIIYKYPILADEVQFEIKRGFKVISVGLDGAGIPSMWIQVNNESDAATGILKIKVIMTGEEFDACKYTVVGTVIKNGIVGHVAVDVKP